MRICIDLDGVVCRLREPGQTYAEIEPIPGAVEKLKALRQAGHYLILYTARHMKTCGGNVGQVIARQGGTTLAWLEKHGIEFDEFHFGKPHADVYIDDNAMRFEGWDKIAADGTSLPESSERRHADEITEQISERVTGKLADELPDDHARRVGESKS
jgi:capsule biosynthesis phosphatase